MKNKTEKVRVKEKVTRIIRKLLGHIRIDEEIMMDKELTR